MKCRLCDKKLLKKVIDLGSQPLANKYPKNIAEIKKEKFYNLSLMFCENCLVVNIKKIISRKEMFEDYYYLSSINLGLVNHFKNLAKKLKTKTYVLDIGSNDGILLKPLKSLGVKAIGIDPSVNVGKIANDQGLETIVDFFTKKSSSMIKKKYGKPDKIIASSIFTHLENPREFALNIKDLLDKKGTFILEVEYLTNFITNKQFERFYFDRPFYYSLSSINMLFKSVGMSLINVEKINTHGGSIRCYIKNIKNQKPSKKVKDIFIKEKKILTCSFLRKFNKKIKEEVEYLKKNLTNMKKKNIEIIGYGSPARVSTITNVGKIDSSLINFIVDDSPLKQNRFSPGMHIPIVSGKKLNKKKIYNIVVFAYDYFEDIKNKTKHINCKYFKPIPFIELK